jgi:hypothetical protein
MPPVVGAFFRLRPAAMWGRLAACAAVDYRRFPVSTRGIPSGSGRLPIGRS